MCCGRAVVRWDVTFKVQNGVFVQADARRRVKISSGVLTICGMCTHVCSDACVIKAAACLFGIRTCAGLRGLLLSPPELLAHEGDSEITPRIAEVLQRRRDALGERGAPTALCTDNIRCALCAAFRL